MKVRSVGYVSSALLVVTVPWVVYGLFQASGEGEPVASTTDSRGERGVETDAAARELRARLAASRGIAEQSADVQRRYYQAQVRAARNETALARASLHFVDDGAALGAPDDARVTHAGSPDEGAGRHLEPSGRQQLVAELQRRLDRARSELEKARSQVASNDSALEHR